MIFQHRLLRTLTRWSLILEDRDTFKIVVHKASKITTASLAERMRPTLPPPADLGRLELFLACTRECHEVFTQCRPPTEFWLPPVAVREFHYSMMKGYLFLAMRYYSRGFVRISLCTCEVPAE